MKREIQDTAKAACKSRIESRLSKPNTVQRYSVFLDRAFDHLSKVYGFSYEKKPSTLLEDLSCCDAVKKAKQVLSEPLDTFLVTGRVSGSLPFGGLNFRAKKGVIATLNSFKKGLPEPCKCSLAQLESQFIERSRQPFIPDARYVKHVKRITRSIFKPGWDRGYIERVQSNSCSLAASAELPRSQLGSFGVLGKGELDDISNGRKECPDHGCVLSTIMSDGKPRVLVKTPAAWQSLRPLHSSIYDRLSKESWLLRGEPTLSKVDGIRKGMKKNEKFLSGDYTSATDFLSIEIAEAALVEMKRSSSEIPPSIWRLAFKSLRPLIHTKENFAYRLKRGQMMGSLLSFPLLCLQNYFATTYVLGKRPMLINGDDLLTRCTKGEYKKWLEWLPRLGLLPSVGKCGFLRSFFTINSEYFQLTSGRIRRVACFKGKSLKSSDEGVPQGEALRKGRGALRGEMKVRYESIFIKTHAKSLCASRRSMKILGWDLFPQSVPRWAAVREYTLRGPHEKVLPPVPEKHSLRMPEGFVLRPMNEVQKRLPDPTFQLVKACQGMFWAEGKDFQRSDAKSIKRDWSAWWEKVRQSGFAPPRWLPRQRVTVTFEPVFGGETGQENFNLLKVHQFSSPAAKWGNRLKSGVGRVLRDLVNKAEGSKEQTLIVPSSLLRRNHLMTFVSKGHEQF